MEILPRRGFQFMVALSLALVSANQGPSLFENLNKIISRQTSVRPVSEYLTPGTKTEIEYDCMPSFANILVASITDLDKNRIIESFGIKKGIELKKFTIFVSKQAVFLHNQAVNN